MDLEDSMLSEISQTEAKFYLSYMWNLKKNPNNKNPTPNSYKKIKFVATTGRGLGEGELEEGVQKIQTFSHKIN